MIKLAKNLSLPLDIVTQTVGVLARKRSGKSYTARLLGEQLFNAGQQIVIVDPKGDHWGIRSSADGKHPGLPVVIIGGERGDVPLEASGGELVAKLVVEERVSVLLDLSLLRKHEVATFMASFLESLYRLKAREVHRTPVMLIIDEADAIAPQKPQPNEARMLGAAEDIVRRGGQRGIGCTMITQRSAVLAKDVLTQIQMLVVLRTIAPQDIKAIGAWIDAHGTPEQGRMLIDSLPSLPVGDGKKKSSEAWFWSPGWPTNEGIFQRGKVLPISTFDSGATPRPGEKRVEPRHLADVDLDALRRQMSETIERAKADDPKVLRAELARLRSELAKAQTSELEIKVPTIELGNVNACRKEGDKLIDLVSNLEESIHIVRESARNIITDLATHAYRLGSNSAIGARAVADPKKAVLQPGVALRQAHPVPASMPPHPEDGDPKLRKGARTMLAQLARMGSLQRRELATLAGLSPKTGTFSNYLSDLKRAGLIAEEGAHGWSITNTGRQYVGEVETRPSTTAEIVSMWGRRFRAGARKMLDVLVARYPEPLTRQELAEATSLSASTGTFSNYLSDLRSNGLVVEIRRGMVAASPTLFPGEGS